MKPAFTSQRHTLCLILGLAAISACASCSRADEVDEIVNAQLAKQHIPGGAVAVVKAGEVVKAGAFGVADLASGAPMKADTIFRIQSMTKQFTATGVMMLVEEGKILLDAPVSRYLDGCPPTWQKITVRHLLNQTSGLKDFVNELTLDLQLDVTDEQLMASVATRSLNFEPGDVWAYSNTNYHLLAMIIRKVTGRWYGDFLAERIFQPLGMSRTAVLRGSEVVANRATGYAIKNGQVERSGTLAPAVSSYGGGGIWSTVLDLAKWDAALYTEKLVKRASLEQMWTPVKLNNGTTHDYGFGWEIGEIANHRRLSHGGNWIGFTAQIDRFVDDQLTIIVLTNLAQSEPQKIARLIAGTYIPAIAPPVYRPIADQEPQVTARFFDVLRRSNEGGLRREEFTPAVWSYIDLHADQMRKDMAAIGIIEKLTLVERSEQDGNRSYRYQARFRRTSMLFHFILTKDNQIAMMMPEEVNQ